MADPLVDDDDAWLYGETSKPEDKEPQEEESLKSSEVKQTEAEEEEESLNAVLNQNDASIDGVVDDDEERQKASNFESGEVSGNEEDQLGEGEKKNSDVDDDDDSDDNDDVHVIIGDIKSAPTYGYGGVPVNLNIKKGSAFSGVPGAAAGKTKGIDLETVGNINGVPIYEFNLDSLEEKPWRKPGADITDYFNYGFNEETWKLYCDRQRKLRTENNVVSKQQTPHTPIKIGDQLIQIATVNENSKYSGVVTAVKKAGPPPGRKMSGCIDVIGGGVPSLPSRRPANNAKENAIQVIGRKPMMEPPPGLPPPPHLAPTHMPPPPFPPPSFDPSLGIPPPPVSLPGIPPPIPPMNTLITTSSTGFPDAFEGFIPRFPPPPVSNAGSDRTSQFDEHSYNGSSSHGQYDRSSTHWNSRERERERDRDRERERERERERDHRDHDRDQRERGRSYSHWEHGTDEERRRYREYRERSRDKGREREYRERERDRDRDSDREKDYDKERERERKHRERKEREERHREHSSRRRHHHEEGSEHEHRMSRHRHKRTKREKDEEGIITEVSEASNFSPEGDDKPSEQ